MRINQLVFLAAVGCVATAAAQTDSRYGGSSDSSTAASGSRFSDLFSSESTRYGDSRATAPSPKNASGANSSTIELRPLRGSTTPQTKPTTRGQQTATSSPASSATPRPRVNSLSSPTTGAGDRRSGRYSGGSATRSPSNAYSQRGAATPPSRAPGERSIAVGGKHEATAHAMLRDMLKAPTNSRLSGTPTRLARVVDRAATRQEQGRAVEEYWALTAAAIDYYLGLAEAQELGRLRQRVPTYSKSLSEALVGLNTRVDTSLKAARAAQLRLGKLIGGGARPLPSDIPFCGPYVTKYQQNFPGGGSEEARLLNDLLPARLAELHAAAEAVDRSNEWLAKVAAAGAGGDGAGMIRALELVALNRRAFVMLARDYNLQINRYTQLTAPDERVDTGRLVAMLIRTDGAAANSGNALANGGGLEFRSGAASRR